MHFITFSGKLGSMRDKIAEGVAQKLGYRLVDMAAVDKAAEEMGMLESVAAIDEKPPSFFQRAFSHRPAVNLSRLSSVIHELARKGDSVFTGRGGQMLLRSFDCGLHVRVVASDAQRIENLMARGFDQKGAEDAIERSDDARAGFIKFAFGVDWEEPRLYDVVLNTSKLSLALAVETVVMLARSGEMQACSLHAVQSLANQALADRAQAAIVEAGLSYGIETAVTAVVEKPNTVELTGLVEEEQSRKRAEEVVKKVQGVKAVDNHLRLRPQDRHA